MTPTTSSESFNLRLKGLAHQVELLGHFSDQFAEKLPAGVAGIMIGDSGKPLCCISTGYSPEDRTRALALAGDVFGTNGWTKTASYDKEFYHWKREIDGVEVTIYHAEPIPMESDKQPVPPAAFPIMLKEVAA
jgi:hypothetical protein